LVSSEPTNLGSGWRIGMAMGRYGSGFARPAPTPTRLETRPKKTRLLPRPVCFNGYPFNPPRRVPDPTQIFFFFFFFFFFVVGTRPRDPTIRLSRFSQSPRSRITEAARRSPRTRRVGVGPSSSAWVWP
jgi:hypothetical protein